MMIYQKAFLTTCPKRLKPCFAKYLTTLMSNTTQKSKHSKLRGLPSKNSMKKNRMACGLKKETKLLLKVGFASTENYLEFIKATGEFIDGIVAINTIPLK